MPSLNDFAEQYANYIRRHRTDPATPGAIARKIKGLTYTDSGKPLSDADIDKLIDEIERVLRSGTSLPGGGRIVEAEDSSRFIKMIKQIRVDSKKK